MKRWLIGWAMFALRLVGCTIVNVCGAFGPSGPLLKMHNMEECKEEASKLWNKRTLSEMHRLSTSFLDQALNEGDGTYKP